MSSLFTHCIRHELFDRINPISTVRHGAGRVRKPDTLELEEMIALIQHVNEPAIRMMVGTAAAAGFRRSEFRGLRWQDCCFDQLIFRPVRGLVNKNETKMKNEASRGEVEMDPALAEALIEWRSKTPYPADGDWVFASPYTKGKAPFWCDTALKNHVKPAAKTAGITKVIGWHTFRRNCASIMSEAGADKKIIQEILRHASGKMTDLYISKSSKAKRTALLSVTGIFAMSAKTKA